MDAMNGTPTKRDTNGPRLIFRRRLEQMLVDIGDEAAFEKILDILEDLFSEEQRLHRNHSFQLVRLQNQVEQVMQLRHIMVTEQKGLIADIADLKGKFAALVMEVHKHKATNTPSAGLVDLEASEASTSPSIARTPSKPNASATVLSKFMQNTGDIEALADQLLAAQRPQLVQCLKSMHAVATSLQATPQRNVLDEKLEPLISTALTPEAKPLRPTFTFGGSSVRNENLNPEAKQFRPQVQIPQFRGLSTSMFAT